MFFKLGLLIGGALTIGLITVALIVNSGDKTAEPSSGPQTVDPTAIEQINEIGVQPANSAKDVQEENQADDEQDPDLLIVWSDLQQGRLTVSLQVNEPDITDCNFVLATEDESDGLKAIAKVLDTPTQRGCVGHFEGVERLTNPVQLKVEGGGQDSSINCLFDLRGSIETGRSSDLLWSSSATNCIGNFNT